MLFPTFSENCYEIVKRTILLSLSLSTNPLVLTFFVLRSKRYNQHSRLWNVFSRCCVSHCLLFSDERRREKEKQKRRKKRLWNWKWTAVAYREPSSLQIQAYFHKNTRLHAHTLFLPVSVPEPFLAPSDHLIFQVGRGMVEKSRPDVGLFDLWNWSICL